MVVKELSKKEIKQYIEKGYIQANIIFEMIGSPKDHIEKAMKLFLENIDSDKDIITIRKDNEETVDLEGGMYSAASECEYLIKGIEKFTWLTFNFMPASIEIVAPKELTFRERDFTNWLNDLLAKLHEVNTIHTAMKTENRGLIKNLNAAIKNNILLVLTEPLTSAQISKKVGVGSKQVLPFIEALKKEGRIVNKGKKYSKVA